MAFSDFKSIQEVIEKYTVKTIKEDFTNNIPELEFKQDFVADIKKSLRMRKSSASEYFLCERLISPLLFEIRKRHEKLNIWSHECYLKTDDPNLSGTPDYIISYKGEEENYERLQYPILTVADAKKDDFMGGWAQILAEMLACQKLNKNTHFTLFGIVSNGDFWQFASFKDNLFIQDPASFSIAGQLNKIAGIIDHIYGETTRQVEEHLAQLEKENNTQN